MKHIVEVNNLLDGVRRSGLLPVSKSRIGDEDLFRRIGIDKLVIKGDPADLFVRKNVSIEVGLLDVQKGKEFYGVFALERSLPSSDAHSFSLFSCKLLMVNAYDTIPDPPEPEQPPTTCPLRMRIAIFG
jgi:hypothetical protein